MKKKEKISIIQKEIEVKKSMLERTKEIFRNDAKAIKYFVKKHNYIIKILKERELELHRP